MTTNCLRCGTPAKAPTPEWTAVQLCDRCFGDVMHYITGTNDIHLSTTRVKAARRLYAVQTRPKCWECGSTALLTRPDEAMGGLTDETVCLTCGEVQVDPDFDPTDEQIAVSRVVTVAEQHRAAWDLKAGGM